MRQDFGLLATSLAATHLTSSQPVRTLPWAGRGPPCLLPPVFKATQQVGCEPARGTSQGRSESTALWVQEAETGSACTVGVLTLTRRTEASEEEVSLCISPVKVRPARLRHVLTQNSPSPLVLACPPGCRPPGGDLHTEGSPGAARQRPQF